MLGKLTSPERRRLQSEQKETDREEEDKSNLFVLPFYSTGAHLYSVDKSSQEHETSKSKYR